MVRNTRVPITDGEAQVQGGAKSQNRGVVPWGWIRTQHCLALGPVPCFLHPLPLTPRWCVPQGGITSPPARRPPWAQFVLNNRAASGSPGRPILTYPLPESKAPLPGPQVQGNRATYRGLQLLFRKICLQQQPRVTQGHLQGSVVMGLGSLHPAWPRQLCWDLGTNPIHQTLVSLGPGSVGHSFHLLVLRGQRDDNRLLETHEQRHLICLVPWKETGTATFA